MTKRPPGTTMEGMIWNANAVLDAALDPKHNGVAKELFEKCQGIVLLSIVTVGFVFSGHSGSGVLIGKKTDGSWSAPSAVAVLGYGGGVLAGADHQDALIFIMDAATLKDFCTRPQTRLSPLAAATIGKNFSRQADVGLEAPDKGTVSVYFSKGLFVGAELEMGTLDSRDKQNTKFYGKDVQPWDILTKDNAVTIPQDSGIPDLHRKLEMLAQGKTWTPGDVDVDKSERLRMQAEKSGEISILQESDVVQVNQGEA